MESAAGKKVGMGFSMRFDAELPLPFDGEVALGGWTIAGCCLQGSEPTC